jgi:hypothetical protein
MRAHAERVCARGTFPLDDWLVPVLYQQEPLDFSFSTPAHPRPPPSNCRRTPATTAIPTALSAATARSWSWSGPCTASRLACLSPV